MGSIDKKIIYICNCEYEYFFNKTNVVGVGLGYKFKNGFLNNRKCIKVFVNSKVSLNRLNCRNIIPMYYKGIETDVVQTGTFLMSSLKNRVRPVTGGYGISALDTISPSGTMACVVTDGHYRYILGSSHVFSALGNLPIDTSIVQPSFKRGGRIPKDKIAILSKYIPINYMTKTSKPENLVDCAIGKIIDEEAVSTKITFLGNIKGTTHPLLGQNVQQVGSTSELTRGEITTIGVTSEAEMKGKVYLFKNQIVTTKMSQKGDSGSILLDNNMHAIGMLMSVGSSNSTFNSINDVLNSLNVSIVTGS